MVEPSRKELNTNVATPAPRRMNQGLFFARLARSAFKDVFCSLGGLILSRVHAKVSLALGQRS